MHNHFFSVRARVALGAIAAAFAAAAAQAQPVPVAPAAANGFKATGVTVIQNATLLTITHGTIDKGSILIRDGKIAAVGTNVSVPQGATVIDAGGKYVMPGIIDCHSHIAVDGSVNEGSVSVSSMVGIEDVLNSDDIDIYRALAGGVTTANVLHGSANAIGGKTQVIKLRWGKDAEGLKFQGALPGIKFALGENPKRANRIPIPGFEGRYPQTRMGVADTIREAFTEAKDYQRKWNDYRAKVAKGDKTAIAPARDLKLDALVEVLEGKRLVHAHSYRSDEILQLIRTAEEMGFKIATFQHVLEGYRVADEIAKHGAGASTFSDWWAYKLEAYDATPYNAALMTERGVVVSINSDSAEEDRHLNQEAAKAVKYGGMSEVEALKTVTLNPAKQLRIDNRVGSIDVGKDADLVVYNVHPLSTYAVPQQVLIDGIVYFDRQKDLDNRAIVQKEKQTLIDKAKSAAPKRAPTGPRPTNGETTPSQTTPRQTTSEQTCADAAEWDRAEALDPEGVERYDRQRTTAAECGVAMRQRESSREQREERR
jgi:imidazolonepropionase-like amidohydrolase